MHKILRIRIVYTSQNNILYHTDVHLVPFKMCPTCFHAFIYCAINYITAKHVMIHVSHFFGGILKLTWLGAVKIHILAAPTTPRPDASRNAYNFKMVPYTL